MHMFSKSNRPVASVCLAALLAFLGFSSYAAAATLTVVVSGVKDTSGQVAVAVFAGPDHFAKDDTKAVRRIMAPIDGASNSATAVVQDLPAGTYAIAVFHDHDNSGKLETNFLGMPTKGYGFSNNPKPKMRAARYDEARFELPDGGAKMQIQLVY